MGAAEVISFEEVRASKPWSTLRPQLHERFAQWLDTLEQVWHEPPATVSTQGGTPSDFNGIGRLGVFVSVVEAGPRYAITRFRRGPGTVA